MSEETGIKSILDWELLHLGDPHEDLAWICVNSWRFGKMNKPVGGFGERKDFYNSYEKESNFKINKKSIQFMEFKEAKSRLTEIGLDINEEFWRTISGNLNKLNEARIWWDVVYGEIDPIIDNLNLIEKAIEFFPEKNLDNTSWGSWCKSISGNSDYKGRDLFISLRKAITGFEYGPELSNLLPLIGKDKILSRMSGKKS